MKTKDTQLQLWSINKKGLTVLTLEDVHSYKICFSENLITLQTIPEITPMIGKFEIIKF